MSLSSYTILIQEHFVNMTLTYFISSCHRTTVLQTSKIDLLGCDVRVYNPKGLPVRDPDLEEEPKVVELRALTHWSDGE